MTFLIAPRRNFDSAFGGGIGIDDAGSFERVDDAKRSIEPARIILAFQVRAGQQFGPGFWTVAEHIANAVDRGGEAGLGKPPGQPFQRAQMRLGERRLVNAGLVGADVAQRMEIGQDAGAIEFRHEPQPSLP